MEYLHQNGCIVGKGVISKVPDSYESTIVPSKVNSISYFDLTFLCACTYKMM